jgi:PhnB protein
MSVKPIPDGYHTVTPFLIVEGAAGLIDFIGRAFNGTLDYRMDLPDGNVMHAQMQIGDSKIMISDAMDKFPANKSVLYLYVKDTDSLYKQAINAGGKSLREPTNEFYGDRSAGITDDYGNQWWIATHVEDVSEEEIKRRQEEFMKQKANAAHA